MAETTLQFRPSACGRFIVALIGTARPHVLPLAEAEAMIPLYRATAANFRESGKDSAARFELASASQLELAVQEAKGRL